MRAGLAKLARHILVAVVLHLAILVCRRPLVAADVGPGVPHQPLRGEPLFLKPALLIVPAVVCGARKQGVRKRLAVALVLRCRDLHFFSAIKLEDRRRGIPRLPGHLDKAWRSRLQIIQPANVERTYPSAHEPDLDSVVNAAELALHVFWPVPAGDEKFR